MHGGRNISLTVAFSPFYVSLLCGTAIRLSVKELYYDVALQETLQLLILSSVFQVMNFMKALDPE